MRTYKIVIVLVDVGLAALNVALAMTGGQFSRLNWMVAGLALGLAFAVLVERP